jgi:TolB-like protein
MMASAAHAGWFFDDEPEQPPKIAVITESDMRVPGANNMPAGRILPDAIGQRIMNDLARSKRFRVVESAVLHRILQERGKEERIGDIWGIVNLFLEKVEPGRNPVYERLRQVGVDAGADYMLIGTLEEQKAEKQTTTVKELGLSVTKGSHSARLLLWLVRVEDASLAGVVELESSRPMNFDASADKDLRQFEDDFCRMASTRVIDELVPPKVVAVGGGFALTRGANDGVRVGDVFEILRPGKEIMENGLLLGTLNSPVGAAKVTNVQSTICTVEPIAGEMREDDLGRIVTSQVQQAAAKGGAAKATASYAGAKLGKGTKPAHLTQIAIGAFEIDSTSAGLREGLGDRLMEDLMVKLQNTKRFSVVELRSMDVTTTAEAIPYVNEVEVDATTSVESLVRIVDVHTGKQVAGEKIFFSADLSQARGVSEFLDLYTSEVTRRVMMDLYPVKVIGVMAGGGVYINRGSDGRIAKGDRFEVYRPGEELIDPDTGVSLGVMESHVASIRIQQVDPAKALGTVVSGDAPQKGDILRPAAKQHEKRPAAGAEEEQQPSYGW